MNQQPVTFSVVIPAYNAAATIERALNSCLQQTRLPDEIIVVNDGSTDHTEAILLGQFGDQIKYTYQSNGGPSKARNTGIGLATGSHLLFLDADDAWHTDKLHLLEKILRGYPNAEFIYHPYTLSPIDFNAQVRDNAITPYPFVKLLLSNPICPSCVLLKRHPGIYFNEGMHHMEDYDLWLREAYQRPVFLLNQPYTRVGRPMLAEGGQSGNRWKMRMGEFTSYWHLTRLHPLFGAALPLLISFGLLKHFLKSFRPPRTNY
jgi:glycosyltransferase involved in cell wall biosynthesis